MVSHFICTARQQSAMANRVTTAFELVAEMNLIRNFMSDSRRELNWLGSSCKISARHLVCNVCAAKKWTCPSPKPVSSLVEERRRSATIHAMLDR